VSLLDGGASLGAPAKNKLAGGAVFGEGACLACPEIDRVGVPGFARSRSQRRGEVEHVRVGRRCVCAVVAHEGVHDAAGAAAAKGALASHAARSASGGTISPTAVVIRGSEHCSARALVPLYEAGSRRIACGLRNRRSQVRILSGVQRSKNVHNGRRTGLGPYASQ